MEYVRLSYLKQQFPGFSFPLSADTVEDFRSAYYNSDSGQKANLAESEQLLNSLQSAREMLFREWTEQEPGLLRLLSGFIVYEKFTDRANLLSHSLLPDYREFITPFLGPKLASAIENGPLANGLSYVILLNNQQAEKIQEIACLQLENERAILEEKLELAQSTEALLTAVQPYLKPEFLEMLNLFTSTFYRVKAAWMSTLLSTIHHKSGSKQLVLYTLKHLHLLQLNPDHREELAEMERAVKSGDLLVEEISFPWRRLVYAGGVASLVFLAIYLVWSVPATTIPEKQHDKTAYMYFSKEERSRMDSLLQQVKTQQQQSNAIDQDDLPFVGVELTEKEELKNERANRLLSNWAKKDTTNEPPKTNESKPDGRTYPATENLRKRNGTVGVQFKNDTKLSVFILVFEEASGKEVYSAYLEKKGIIDFRVNPGERLFCLPGTQSPAKPDENKLPFEHVDSRFFQHLQQEFSIDTGVKSMKLVWKEIGSYDFYLLDVNGGLEMH